MIYPDGTQETWSYDLAGQLTTYLNRSGQIKRVTYHAAAQPLTEVWSNPVIPTTASLPALPPDVRYDYDRGGRLSSLQSVNGEQGAIHLTYTYDKLRRLASETTHLAGLVPGLSPQTVTYGYDELGRRSGLGYPDKSKVAYTYDARNRLVGIDDRGPGANSPLAAYAYDPLGRVAKLTRDNGVATRYTFDMAGQLTAIEHGKGGEVLAAAHYTLDILGRRTGQSREDGIREIYTYDATSQLTGVDYGSQSRGTETFRYDAVGNRMEAGRITASATIQNNYQSNNLNQYTAVANTAFTYDTNGNLVNDGRQTYRYDAQNRLISVEGVAPSTPVRAEFFYDARNRCVLRKFYTRSATGLWVLNPDDSRALTYDTGWNLLAERKLTGVQTGKYIHGQRTDEILAATINGQTVHPLADGLGSTVALTNKHGKVTQRFRYDAYGRSQAFSANYQISNNPQSYRFLFTGREWLAPVGLNDHRHRYYSPSLGRWPATDPIGFSGGRNLYEYAGSSPNNFNDPFGLMYEDDPAWGAYLECMLGCKSVPVCGGQRLDCESGCMRNYAEAKKPRPEPYNRTFWEQVDAGLAGEPTPDAGIWAAIFITAGLVAEAAFILSH